MAIVDKLITAAASHQIYIERLAATLGNNALPYLENIENRVAQLLAGLSPSKVATEAQKLRIISRIDEITREELQAYTREYKKDNAEFGGYEARFQSSVIDDVIETDEFLATTATVSSVRQIATATPIKLGENQYTTYGRFLTGYWQSSANKVNGIVINAFNQGLTNQETAQQIAREISLDYDDSALSQARRAAKTLARTGTNHMANSARIATADDNSDIVKGYLYVATLDMRTSQQCRSLDGTTYKLDEPNIPFTPQHPNCRSAMTYEIDARYGYDDDTSQRPINFRVDGKADTKRINSKNRYYGELSKLKASDQDAVLGPTLGKAFRKMSPDDFAKQTIDSLNNPLTINELLKSNKEIGRVLRSIKN